MLSFTTYLLFTVSYFLHLTSRVPALGAARFDLLLMVVLFVFFLLALGDTVSRYKDSNITKKLILFIVFFLLTIPLVKWPGSVIKYGSEWYLKVVFFYFFTLAFVTTEKRLKVFLVVFLGCQIFRGLEPAWLHYTQGYWGDVAFSGGGEFRLNRLSGAPHDIVNPNQLAWVIINTVPFLFFLGWRRRRFVTKLGVLFVSALLLYVLMLTGSRSGLICLFAVFLGIVFFSKNRWKNLAILCFVIIPVAIVVSGLLSPDMAERYRSIFDSSAVGADTAAGRYQGWIDNLSTILNPYGVLGHGLGTNGEVNVNYLNSHLKTHNLYLETMQEVGIVGFILFGRYIVSIIKALHSVQLRLGTAPQSFLYRLVSSLLVWVFMELIYSMSCFGLSSWEWYLFGGIASVVALLGMQSPKKLDSP